MKRILPFLLLLAVGCRFFHKHSSPYKGYSTDDDVTYCKYEDLNASRKKASPGTIVEALLSYKKMNDSVFWRSRDKGFPYSIFLSYAALAGGSTYERQLLKAAEGDSISYIVPADSVFKNIFKLPLPYFFHTGDKMKVSARIMNIMDSGAYATRCKTIKDYQKNMDMQEQVNLARYISSNNIPDSDKHQNVYIIPEEMGKGPTLAMGCLVDIAYKGYFLNGQSFDSVSEKSPLQFRYGDTDQMITGLSIGIKKMREGGKAKIIIPSQLAFGENGSSTGIVPPYTTVVYEVTVLKVMNGPVTKN